MKSQKALFLQSWYSKVTDNWYPWLKKELDKKGYTTYFPDIPEMRKDVPDMSKILKYIESLKVIDKDTIIVGHSLGNLLAMRLAEKFKYKQMILVSAWDYDDLCEGHKLFWKNKINHAKIKKNVKNIVVIHSDNDPYYTQISAEDTSKRLNAKFVLIKNGGHFGSKERIKKLPQILEFID
ncbi:MAG TPA: alpha/beta hydrolase [Alphaproteobacteria bacterium]|jgi:predicted alpha/beta hydrolase family esterase|nr:alpha/beta hydrolase [Alphaproteobacteria bacterium]